MSEFNINLNNVKSEIDTLQKLEADFEMLIENLQGVMNNFAINADGMESLKTSLRKQVEKANDEKEILATFSATLGKITADYEKAENKLLQNDELVNVKKEIEELSNKIEEFRKNTKGMDDSCGYSKDPVNLCNGNYVYEKTLLEIKAAYPIRFRIFYNSMDDQKGVMGKGWFHDYESYLYKVSDVHIKVILPEKKEASFISKDKKIYRSMQDPTESLCINGKTYCLTLRNGHKYIFSDKGMLIAQRDEFDNGIEFKYDEQNHLVAILVEGEEKLTLSYIEEQLVSISASERRKIQFNYTAQNMTEITYFEQDGLTKLQVYKFGYDKENRLYKLITADDTVCLENQYDNNSRVIKQTFADGGIVSYEYLDEKQAVITTEQNLNQIRHVHDNLYRSTEDCDDRGVERYQYNEWNQKILHVDRKGNETKFEYDQNGYLINIVEPCGIKKNFEYTADHKIKAYRLDGVVQVQGEYDDKGNVTLISDALGRKQKISYDQKGHAVKVTLPDHSCMELTYDNLGNLIRIKNATGIVNEYEYDKWHRVIATIDGNQNRTEFIYNNKDEIIKVINAKGESRSYIYDQNGMLTKVVDFNGGIYQTEYNEINKPKKYIDANGNVTELKYDIMWHLSEKIEPNQAVSKYEYDYFGRLIKEIDPYGGTIQYEYDAVDNCIKKIGKLGEIYTYEYDEINRLTKMVEPNGQVTMYQYNALDRITEIINTYGKSKKYEYDAAGQKIKETDEAGNSTYYTYNEIGKIEKVEDKKGLWISYEYYPGGYLKKVQYSNGKFFEFKYDGNGNLIQSKNQDDYWLQYSYDCLNQRILAEDSEGAKEAYTFDAVGNIISRERQGELTSYEYTANGKLSAVIDALGNKTQYTYDAMDQLVEILQTQQNNSISQHTVYERDLLERVVKITDSLGREESYSYDLYGNIIQKVDADQYTTRYEYTDYGVPEKIFYGDGKTVRYSYNQLKQLVEIEDWLGTTKISVDELGRARTIKTHDEEIVQYEFGTHGEKKKVIYPDGYEVAYEYNGNLQLLSLNMGKDFVRFQYDKFGNRIQKIDSNGMQVDYSYDKRGNVEAIVTKEKEQLCQKMHYEYDSFNRCTSWLVENTYGLKNNMHVEYDIMGRISRVRENGELVRAYEYDGFGNRICKLEDGVVTNYTYNLANQLLSESIGGQVTSYEYDGRGNLVKQKNQHQEMNYYYDAMNRLSSITKNTEGSRDEITYLYNGLGYRVGQKRISQSDQKYLDKSEKKYCLDLTLPIDNLLMEKQSDVRKHYVWHQGLQAVQSNSQIWSISNDRLQSPSFMSNGAGNHHTMWYDEFGNSKEAKALDVDILFGFTGYAEESISSIYFAQAREYMPGVGRFGSKDAIAGNIFEPSTLNRYTYCYNDGMNYTDRTGYWFGLDDAIAAGVGAVVGVGAQFVTDTVKGFVKGDFSYDWEDYVGSAVGGAAGGVTTLYAGPVAGCAVESGLSTLVSGGIKMADGKSNQSVGELLVDTGVNTGLGGLFGKFVPELKIPKITKGRGSYAAVFKAGITKIQRGIAKRMSLKVVAKGVASSLLGGAIATFVSGITSELYDALKNSVKGIFDSPDKYIDMLKEFFNPSAECPVQNK